MLLASCSTGKNDTSNDKPYTAEKKDQHNSVSSNGMTDEITKESYTDNDIKINYPQIKNLSDSNKQKIVNKIIKNEALKGLNYYSGTNSGLTMEINYDIKLKSANLLSIQYSGIGSVKRVAHPNNLFYTTNIDINKGCRLRLKDIVTIDEHFVEAFKKDKKALNPEHSSLLDSFSDEDLIKDFRRADSLDNIGTENQSDTFSYLTKDSLGISISVGHAAGDHAEFEIKYRDIQTR